MYGSFPCPCGSPRERAWHQQGNPSLGRISSRKQIHLGGSQFRCRKKYDHFVNSELHPRFLFFGRDCPFESTKNNKEDKFLNGKPLASTLADSSEDQLQNLEYQYQLSSMTLSNETSSLVCKSETAAELCCLVLPKSNVFLYVLHLQRLERPA